MKFFVAVLALCAVTHGTIIREIPAGSVPKLDGRIVGGQQGDIRDFPYQVSVRVYDQHICGGSILDQETIVTAAHCVHEMGGYPFSIRVGNNNNNNGKQVLVSEIRKHGGYNPRNQDNDVAILKLSSRLQYSDSVQPIALASQEVAGGSAAVVSGWGVTAEGSQVVPDLLRYVELDVLDRSSCNRMNNGQITNNMVCTLTRDKDACQGDSGGPLASGGRLIGVVSWGYGCARPTAPGVYSNVAQLRSWIEANAY